MQRFKEFLGEASFNWFHKADYHQPFRDLLKSNKLEFDNGDPIDLHPDTIKDLSGFFSGSPSRGDFDVKFKNDKGTFIDAIKLRDGSFIKWKDISKNPLSGNTPGSKQFKLPTPPTEFYEQWASIGLVCPDGVKSDLTSFLGGTVNPTFPSVIQSLYRNHRGDVQGKKDFSDIVADDKVNGSVSPHLPTVANLLLGSLNLRSSFPEQFTGSYQVINGDIDKYYAIMKSFTTIGPDGKPEKNKYLDLADKENTADAVVLSGFTLSNLQGWAGKDSLKILSSDEYTEGNHKSGVIIVLLDGEVKGTILQVSMKKDKGEARIGKIKDILTAWGIWSPSRKTDVIKRIMGEEWLLDEGVADWIRGGFKWALLGISKIRQLVKGVISKISGSLLSIAKRFNFKKQEKDLISRLMPYIKEEYIGEMSQADVPEAVSKSREAITILNQEMEDKYNSPNSIIQRWFSSNAENIKMQSDFANIQGLSYPEDPAVVRMAMANIVSWDGCIIPMLDQISSDQNSYEKALDMFIGLYRSSVMGNTFLPVIKLYGTSDVDSWHVYKRSDFEDKKSKVRESPYLGGLIVNAHRTNNKYAVIYFYTVGDIKDDGSLLYNVIRPTPYGGTNFKIEIDSQIDESTFKKKFGLLA